MTADCPQRRTRLFLSVDLVGSTAFKGGPGSDASEQSAYPLWVDEIRSFYQEFPAFLRKRYLEHLVNGESESLERRVPILWKTIGDELIFCCRLLSTQHLVCAVSAFIEALDDYGSVLEARCPSLDVKGTGWLAAFPAPNITVVVQASQVSDLPTEADENLADDAPEKCDFLGPGIDSGFRLSKFSAIDKFTISAELAYALCRYDHIDKKSFGSKFHYLGRESLSGVLGGRPYPIIIINTERSALRREVFELERNLRGFTSISSHIPLRNFLEKFMIDEGIEIPSFELHGSVPTAQPESYTKFVKSWEQVNTENMKRSENEIRAATQEPLDTSNSLPAEVLDVAERVESGSA